MRLHNAGNSRENVGPAAVEASEPFKWNRTDDWSSLSGIRLSRHFQNQHPKNLPYVATRPW